MSGRKILIAGGSGLVGLAALKHFAAHPDWDVVGLSRRRPDVEGAVLLSVDLRDRDECARALSELADVTHLVYTAVYERPDLLDGWTGRDSDHTQINLAMLRNVLEPLEAAAKGLRHVSLFQGTKAYGAHLGIPLPVPLRERHPRVEHDNFYFAQQDYLAERQRGKDWAWTVWRPQLIFGESLGNPMSMLPALGVYAALLREDGEPLHYPGNVDWWEVREAIDTEMIAAALEWAADNPVCRNEVYNLANGDQLVWKDIWPVIADALGMKAGEDRPVLLDQAIPPREAQWLAIAERHALRGPRALADLVGQGFVFTDHALGHGKGSGHRAVISATTKLRQHGFHMTVDTEEMLRKWFGRLQADGVLPPP